MPRFREKSDTQNLLKGRDTVAGLSLQARLRCPSNIWQRPHIVNLNVASRSPLGDSDLSSRHYLKKLNRMERLWSSAKGKVNLTRTIAHASRTVVIRCLSKCVKSFLHFKTTLLTQDPQDFKRWFPRQLPRAYPMASLA